MSALGNLLSEAGERMSAWALDRLAVIGARSERRYPIVGLILAVLAWVPLVALFLLLKDRF